MFNSNLSKRWDHTLKIKDIFMDLDPLPAVEETILAAHTVADRIEKLRTRLGEKDSLSGELEEPVDRLRDIAGIENAYEARDRFNAALGVLYDIGDYNKRIWIA